MPNQEGMIDLPGSSFREVEAAEQRKTVVGPAARLVSEAASDIWH